MCGVMDTIVLSESVHQSFQGTASGDRHRWDFGLEQRSPPRSHCYYCLLQACATHRSCSGVLQTEIVQTPPPPLRAVPKVPPFKAWSRNIALHNMLCLLLFFFFFFFPVCQAQLYGAFNHITINMHPSVTLYFSLSFAPFPTSYIIHCLLPEPLVYYFLPSLFILQHECVCLSRKRFLGNC